jgi:hypothetical protein
MCSPSDFNGVSSGWSVRNGYRHRGRPEDPGWWMPTEGWRLLVGHARGHLLGHTWGVFHGHVQEEDLSAEERRQLQPVYFPQRRRGLNWTSAFRRALLTAPQVTPSSCAMRINGCWDADTAGNLEGRRVVASRLRPERSTGEVAMEGSEVTGASVSSESVNSILFAPTTWIGLPWLS